MDGKTSGSGAPPALHGVPFDVWGFVLAGLGDGLPLEELLAHVGVDEGRWMLADAAFNEALVDDVEAGGTLSDALDEAMREARTRWTRAIPPLDVELRAWLDFYRAWAEADAPLEYLRARGLRATDIHRLQAHWRARLAEAPALRAEALAILEAPPGPVPELHPEPARLLHQEHAHREVVVEEPSRVFPVGADPAHDSGQMEDDVRPGGLEHPDDVRLTAQVAFAAARRHDRPAAAAFELFHDIRSEKSVPAGDDDSTVRPHVAVSILVVSIHACLLSA